MSRSVDFLLIAAISAVVFLGCKKERSFRGANPGDEIVFGGTAGSVSGFRSSKTKGGDGDSSVAGAFAGAGLDASEMESCVSYDSDADETYFFDWEDFEGGDALGSGFADNEVHDASSVVNACKGFSSRAGSESLSGGESGVSCGDGISGAYLDDRANGSSSFGSSDAGNGLFGVKDSDVQTKTDYSGHKENVGSKTYERIDWVVGDKVKIFANGVKPPKTECVYEVSHVTASGSRSSAGLRPLNAPDGHGLLWDSGNADFYAFYPGNSPAKVSASNTSSNFEVTVKLPKEQNTSTKITSGNHIEFKPDMELAAMLAVSRNVSLTSSVQLDFLPLVTTFRITLSNSLPNDDMKINKVSLVYSPSAPTPVFPMSGDYAVKYDKTSGSTLSSHSSAGLQPVNTSSITSPAQEISVNLGSDAVTLTKNNGNTFSVTLFAVPVSHKGLQLKINVTQGGNTEDRMLDLKQNSPGDWVEFKAYKKYDIKVGTSNRMEDYLEVSPSLVLYYYGGTIYNGWVKSYRTDGVETKPLPWNVVGYSETSETGPFTSTPPAWLTSFPSYGDGVASSLWEEYITASVSAQKLTITTPNFRNTALRSKNEVGSQANPIDLSRVPVGNSPFFSIADNATASTYAGNQMNTANCYVVTRPGWYKIPVVYGNAIKNNGDNQNSYKPSGSGNNFLTDFIRHDGNAITNPWIKDNGINLNNGVAKLVWQDQPNLVQSIEFDKINKDYISFYISKTTIHEGNAVIALKESASGDIVWSWHIWVYGGNDLKVINVKNNKAKVTSPKPGRDNFDFLSENLGACHDSGETITYLESNVWVKISNGRKTKIIKITRNSGILAPEYNNPYYQWGRKDPMLPSDGTTSNKNKLWYDKAGAEHLSSLLHEGWASDGTVSGANAEIANTIKHPGIFNSSSRMDNYYYNLWDTSCNEITYNEEDINQARFLPVTKSVYDPCPPGFSLHPNGAFTGLTESGVSSYLLSEFNVSGSFDKGWNFRTVLKNESGGTTIFFPASGERFNYESLLCVGINGSYWSSVPSREYIGCFMMFSTDYYVGPLRHVDRVEGKTLRPVKE